MKLCEIAMTCVLCFLLPTFPLLGKVGKASVNVFFFLDFMLFTNVTLQTVTSSSLMCFELGREQTIYANLALYNLCVLPCQKWDTSPSPPKPPNYAQLSHSWVSGLVTLRGDGKKTFQLLKVLGALLCCYHPPRCTTELHAFYGTHVETAAITFSRAELFSSMPCPWLCHFSNCCILLGHAAVWLATVESWLLGRKKL